MMKFLREAFSKPDGTASFGALISAILFMASIVHISYLVWHNHALPDALTLAALGGFDMLPYGASKTTALIAEVKNPTPPGEPPKSI